MRTLLVSLLLLSACGDDDSTDASFDASGDAVATLDADHDGAPDGGLLDGPDANLPDGESPDAGPVGVTARSPDGRFGEAVETLTLPGPMDGGGLYVPDVQERYPDTDWANLDRLYIPAGHYQFIRLGNLPDRDPADPLVITNLGGQVRVGGLDFHYLFAISGGSGWVLSGRYDPLSATGDAAFPGHRDNQYANTAGTYGILVDDDFSRDGLSGISIGGGASAFEVEFMEVREVGFAGMSMKTDDDGGATMRDVWLHDLYIHDTESEGFYIGSTQTQPQHTIEGFEIDHCRVLRTGTEAVQLGQLAGDNDVHHNVFGPAAIDWRASFQAFQDGNLQVAIRSGTTRVHHNVFIGAAGSLAGIFGTDVAGDTHGAADAVVLADNYIAHFRNLGVYAHHRDVSPLTVRVEDNAIRGFVFDRDEVYADATPPGHLIRRGVGETPMEVLGNHFDAMPALCNATGDECNGDAANFHGEGNVRETVAPMAFRDAGLPADFDYLELEMWTDVASRGAGMPVTYPRDQRVMHFGVLYRCDRDTCRSGDVPGASDAWEMQPALPDDLRSTPGGYADVGLGIDG